MLSKLEKTLIFIGDLLPIFLIGTLLSLQPYSWYKVVIFLLLLLISILGTSYWGKVIKDSVKYNEDVNFLPKNKDHEIVKIEDRGSIYTIYMITFVSLIPLFYKGFFGFLSFFVIIWIVYSLYMNSDMLFYNPVLALFGYKFYKFDLTNEDEIYVISKDLIYKKKDREQLTFYSLTDFTYFVKRESR